MKKIVLLCLLLVACGSSSTDATTYMPLYATSGSSVMSISISVTRTTGVSPLTVWYDATTSTDSAVSNPFTDLSCTWDFGDTGASGTGTWSTGNPSNNSMNAGRGLIAAHTYVVPDGGGDTSYTASVTCKDVSGNSATGNATQITVYDPTGANGFSAANTTCFYNTTVGTGCPAGAASVSTSVLSTPFSATYFGNGKRILFKCGDSFSGDNVTVNATGFFVGAYGSCVSTKTGRPTFVSTGVDPVLAMANTSSAQVHDGRFSDVGCNGNGNSNQACISQPFILNGHLASQITMYNLFCTGCTGDFAWNGGWQMALVWSSKDDSKSIGTFINSGEYTGSSTWVAGGCPDGTKASCMDYQAIIGNDLAAPSLIGRTGTGVETIRFSGGRYMVVSNNWIRDSSVNGGNFKMACIDAAQFSPWQGDLNSCQYVEISDNHFGDHLTTTDGALLVDLAPQSVAADERMGNVVFENNFLDNAVPGGRSMTLSVQNVAVRNNIFWMDGNEIALQVSTYTTASWPTTNVGIYNNSFYDPALAEAAARFIYLGTDVGLNSFANPTNVTVKNNLIYSPAGTGSTIVDDSGLNTVSNNTVTMTNNPAWTNGSTTLSTWTDYKPTANYTGAANAVPGEVYDALGTAWSPTWDLGAVHH